MYNIFVIINGNTCTNYGTIYKYNYNEISFEEKFKFIENKIEDCINYFFSSFLKISNSTFRYESLSYFSLKKETKTRTSLTRVSYTMETYDIDALCILSFLSISRHFQRRVIRYTVSYLHNVQPLEHETDRITSDCQLGGKLGESFSIGRNFSTSRRPSLLFSLYFCGRAMQKNSVMMFKASWIGQLNERILVAPFRNTEISSWVKSARRRNREIE